MAFNHAKITGNGTAQNAVINSTNTESVVHGLIAYNTTGSALDFSLLIDGSTVITETVEANSSYRLPDKVNVPVNSTLTVNAATGVSVTISYLQQAIDVNAALTAVQQFVADAKADANRAENALPAGSIDDASTAVDRAWSANKISTELGNKADLTGADFTGGIGEGYNLVSSSAGTLTLDLSTGNNFEVVLSENTTLAVTNAPTAGTAYALRLKIIQDASGSGFTFTWPTGGKWASATAPTLTATASAEDVFVLYSDDGFTTWDGHVAGQAMGVPA